MTTAQVVALRVGADQTRTRRPSLGSRSSSTRPSPRRHPASATMERPATTVVPTRPSRPSGRRCSLGWRVDPARRPRRHRPGAPPRHMTDPPLLSAAEVVTEAIGQDRSESRTGGPSSPGATDAMARGRTETVSRMTPPQEIGATAEETGLTLRIEGRRLEAGAGRDVSLSHPFRIV